MIYVFLHNFFHFKNLELPGLIYTLSMEYHSRWVFLPVFEQRELRMCSQIVLRNFVPSKKMNLKRIAVLNSGLIRKIFSISQRAEAETK
jgi:hypothetical protein